MSVSRITDPRGGVGGVRVTRYYGAYGCVRVYADARGGRIVTIVSATSETTIEPAAAARTIKLARRGR